jgi:ferrous-iron efflux pump FieF
MKKTESPLLSENTPQKSRSSGESSLMHAALASVLLAGVKGAAFALTGSLIVLASFLDSVVDFLASATNLKIHQFSRADADQQHPFGHGGFEVVGSLVQGVALVFTGIAIFIEGLRRIVSGNPVPLSAHDLILAISVLIFAALSGYGIQAYLSIKIRQSAESHERSLVLMADNAHYLGDAYSNLLSAAGLAIVFFTKITEFDAIFAALSGIFLIKTAYPIIKKCFFDIVHQEADPKFQRQIAEIVLHHDERITGIHHLRTRELGPHLFIDFHLSVAGAISLNSAHEISENAEKAIVSVIPRADIMIHLDPDSDQDHNDWYLQGGLVVGRPRPDIREQ